MSPADLLGFWFPLCGVFGLGLLWLLLRDTLDLPPGGGDGGDPDGGSDRVPRPRPPWSWNRRTGRSDAGSTRTPRRPRVRR